MAITKQPGQSFEANVTGFSPGLATVRVGIYVEPSRSSTAVYGPSTAGVQEDDGTYYKVDFEAPDTGAQYWLIWEEAAGSTNPALEELVVSYTAPEAITGPTFASPEDVAARLGRALTEAEEAQVDFLLLAATEFITMAVGKDAEWAAGLDVPNLLRFICADMVARALSFSPGINSTTESLGEYSVTERSDGESYGLWMTDWERLLARRVVNGSGSGSARVDSIASDLYPEPVVP